MAKVVVKVRLESAIQEFMDYCILECFEETKHSCKFYLSFFWLNLTGIDACVCVMYASVSW